MSKKSLTSIIIISMIICSSLLIGQVTSDMTSNPTKIEISVNPSSIPAPNSIYNCISIQLQETNGTHTSPTRHNHKPLIIWHKNRNSDQTVTIPFGKTGTTGTLTVTNAPGEAVVTAQASGYSTGEATLTTYTVDFSKLAFVLTANPQSISSANTTEITAYITAESTPITGATLQFTSNSNGTFTEAREGQAGYYKASFTAASYSKTTTCTITVNGSKTGFLSALGSAQITVVPPPTTDSNVNSTGNSVSSNKLQVYIKDSSDNYVSDALVCSTTNPLGSRRCRVPQTQLATLPSIMR